MPNDKYAKIGGVLYATEPPESDEKIDSDFYDDAVRLADALLSVKNIGDIGQVFAQFSSIKLPNLINYMNSKYVDSFYSGYSSRTVLIPSSIFNTAATLNCFDAFVDIYNITDENHRTYILAEDGTSITTNAIKSSTDDIRICQFMFEKQMNNISHYNSLIVCKNKIPLLEYGFQRLPYAMSNILCSALANHGNLGQVHLSTFEYLVKTCKCQLNVGCVNDLVLSNDLPLVKFMSESFPEIQWHEVHRSFYNGTTPSLEIFDYMIGRAPLNIYSLHALVSTMIDRLNTDDEVIAYLKSLIKNIPSVDLSSCFDCIINNNKACTVKLIEFILDSTQGRSVESTKCLLSAVFNYKRVDIVKMLQERGLIVSLNMVIDAELLLSRYGLNKS